MREQHRIHRASAVVVELPEAGLQALIRVAVREDRSVAAQARRLLIDALRPDMPACGTPPVDAQGDGQ